MRMPDDKIQFLVRSLLAAEDPVEVRIIAFKLQEAIHEHVERIRHNYPVPDVVVQIPPIRRTKTQVLPRRQNGTQRA